MRILMSAYACSPSAGSESAVGWRWAVATAEQGHDVTVLTTADARQAIEVADHPPSLRFAYVAEPAGAGLVPGQLHWYVRYLRWQRAARRRAVQLQRADPFDVVHHLTWASLQLGTALGDIGPPLVFGPAGGGQVAPAALRPYHRGSWWTERLRTVVTTRLIRLDPFAVRAMRRAALAVADNEETAALMRRLGARLVHHQTQCGVHPAQITPPDPAKRDRDVLQLVWVGRLMPRKGVALAIEAFRRLPEDVPARLRIVGYGPQAEHVDAWIAAAGQGHRVTFTGRVPHEEVDAVYRAADALLFTSLRDSGGIQLVEAMGQGLPCIVLRHQGAKILVGESAGLQVPVTDAEGTAGQMAAAIARMASDRDLWWSLAEGAHARALELTWAALVRDLQQAVEAALDAG